MISRTWISRIAVIAIALGSSLAMVAHDAEAKRFGGGKSFGRQSSNVNRSATPATPAQATPSQAQAAPAAAGQPQRNRWLGPVAGIAAGLGLAALFSHMGLAGPLAEMMGSFLMIALLVMAGLFIWRMLKRGQAQSAGQPAGMQRAPAYATARSQNAAPQDDERPYQPTPMQPVVAGGASNSVLASFNDAPNWGIPGDFDKEGFERSAKVHFIRLQAAWDARDISDIREFTTPEMYAEVKMQLSEEKGAPSQTEVVDLEAEVLGVERGAQEELASVRFKGTIRENVGAAAEPFEEVWNLLKPTSGRSGWLLAGIQQVH